MREPLEIAVDDSLLKRQSLLVLALVFSCLMGCTSPVGFATSSLAPEQSALVYFQWIRGASPEARQTELLNLRSSVPVNPVQHQAKLAMLLSVPDDASAEARAEATSLLRALLVDAETSAFLLPLDYQVFAAHWLDVLDLREQLNQLSREQAQTAGALTDIQNRQADLQQRYELLSATLEAQEQSNEELRQRNAVLQRQLDALNGIEQQLIEQGETSGSGDGR